jgi:alkylation response protein AidB-like acyl-CoA dehydrogenase
MTIDWSASTPFFNDDHRAYAEVVRQFTTNEIVPYVDDWERAGMVARDLYNKAAQIGLFGDGFEAEYGGHGQRDALMRLVIMDEVSQAGAGGVSASMLSRPELLHHVRRAKGSLRSRSPNPRAVATLPGSAPPRDATAITTS